MQSLIDRLNDASHKFSIELFSEKGHEIRKKDHWRYFCYVASDRHQGYWGGLNQFFIAHKDGLEQVIYYWYANSLLDSILLYSRRIDHDLISEFELNLLFGEYKGSRPMFSTSTEYSMEGARSAKEFIDNGWNIHYEAYYNSELLNESNYKEINQA